MTSQEYFSMAAVLGLAGAAAGMPPIPVPALVEQPDGAKITVRVRGNEQYRWYEDTDGYAVVTSDGAYVYARENSFGELEPTDLRVGRDDPRAAGLGRNLRPSPRILRQYAASAGSPNVPAQVKARTVSTTGTLKNLVILCKFSDHTAGVHTRNASDYNTLYNATSADGTLCPTGSVRMCFLENSYNQLTIESTVVGWVTLPQTQAYYGNGNDGTGSYPQNAQGMVRDALNLVDASVDFGDYDTDNDGYIDAISIIHSGYGAETGGGAGNWIWSHKWSLWALPGGRWTSGDTNGNGVAVKVYDYHTEPALWGTSGTSISRIGVAVHETGHFLGLPDLYDTDGSSEGIGSWCMMANSWGFTGNQLNPPHFSAWAKARLNWLTPTVISSPGGYSLPRAETSASVYRIDEGFPSNEYLLIENRQAYGFESTIPQGGLAIWHIDMNKYGSVNNDEGYPGQSGWPTNNKHYSVALLAADGLYEGEKNIDRGDAGDVYHGGGTSTISPSTTPSTNRYQGGTVASTNNTISGISASGATMTFTYANGEQEATAAAELTSPSNGSTLTGASVTFAWSSGTGVSEYALGVGISPTNFNVHLASAGTDTSVAVSAIPVDGRSIYVRLWSLIGSTWYTKDYTFTAAVVSGGGKAVMTSPSNGSTLSGTSQTFTWSAGASASEYFLYVGGSAGANGYYGASQGTGTSVSVTGLPSDASTLYVRLWSKVGGAWVYNDYTYTSSGTATAYTAGTITTPSNQATLSGADVTFAWTGGQNVSEYYLGIGTRPGAFNLYYQSEGTDTSSDITGLPVDGSTIYVRLWSLLQGRWHHVDHVFTTHTAVGGGRAVITSHNNNDTLGASSATFTWTSVTGATEYFLWVGTDPGGYNIHAASAGTNTSVTVNNLPQNGRRLYVRLWTLLNGAWGGNDIYVNAQTVAGGGLATMTAPANGATLAGASDNFTWSSGTGVDEYFIWVGSRAGAYNYYAGSQGASTSGTINTLPTGSVPVYLRLWSRKFGKWDYNDYQYTSAP